jgi:hypothetical protein
VPVHCHWCCGDANNGSVYRLYSPDWLNFTHNCVVSTTVPDLEGLRKRFLDTISPTDVLPYFEGYFGEHESMHPGLIQANGGFHPFGTNPAHGKSNNWASKLGTYLGSTSPNWSHPYPSFYFRWALPLLPNGKHAGSDDYDVQ